jgi:hypothetical protein
MVGIYLDGGTVRCAAAKWCSAHATARGRLSLEL